MFIFFIFFFVLAAPPKGRLYVPEYPQHERRMSMRTRSATAAAAAAAAAAMAGTSTLDLSSSRYGGGVGTVTATAPGFCQPTAMSAATPLQNLSSSIDKTNMKSAGPKLLSKQQLVKDR